MKIKEQDELHMVIGPTIGERLGSAFGLVVFIVLIIFVQFSPIILVRALFSVVGLVGVLVVLRTLVGARIIIDKPTRTVTISKRSFFLTGRQRIIPFSDVRSVTVDYEPQTSMITGEYGSTTISHDAWSVSLDIGEKFKIDHNAKESDMMNLARGISRFTGKGLVDNSAKPALNK